MKKIGYFDVEKKGFINGIKRFNGPLVSIEKIFFACSDISALEFLCGRKSEIGIVKRSWVRLLYRY